MTEIDGLSEILGIFVLAVSSKTTTVVLVTLFKRPPVLELLFKLSAISITSPGLTKTPAQMPPWRYQC